MNFSSVFRLYLASVQHCRRLSGLLGPIVGSIVLQAQLFPTQASQAATPPAFEVQTLETRSIARSITPQNTSQEIAQTLTNRPLSELELAIVAELNQARTNPAGYAAWLENQRQYYSVENGTFVLRLPGESPQGLREGEAALISTIASLQQLEPRTPLTVSDLLTYGVQEWVNAMGSQGATGGVDVEGNDQGFYTRNYGLRRGAGFALDSYRRQQAAAIVLAWMVSDGDPARSIRQALLTPELSLIGVACGDHLTRDVMCSISIAQEFAPLTTPIPQMPAPAETIPGQAVPQSSLAPDTSFGTAAPATVTGMTAAAETPAAAVTAVTTVAATTPATNVSATATAITAAATIPTAATPATAMGMTAAAAIPTTTAAAVTAPATNAPATATATATTTSTTTNAPATTAAPVVSNSMTGAASMTAAAMTTTPAMSVPATTTPAAVPGGTSSASSSQLYGLDAPPSTPEAFAQGIIAETNRLRSNPAAYAAELETLIGRFNGNKLEIPELSIAYETYEGTFPVYEAIEELRQTPSLPTLSFQLGLSQAAQTHVTDMGLSGYAGHIGTDGSKPLDRALRFGRVHGIIGENISYQDDRLHSPQWHILMLLVDDNVPDRGHRRALLNPEYQVTGTACGPHIGFGNLCVMTYADGFDDAENVADGLENNESTGNPREISQLQDSSF